MPRSSSASSSGPPLRFGVYLLTACHFHRPIVLLTVSDRRDMAYAPRDFPVHCCRSLRCGRWCATRAPCHQPSYPRTRGCHSWPATLGRFAAALAMIVLFNALDIQRQLMHNRAPQQSRDFGGPFQRGKSRLLCSGREDTASYRGHRRSGRPQGSGVD